MKRLHFIFHLLLALGISALLLVGSHYLLDSYTNHGSTSEVPNVSKMTLPQAIKTLQAKGFSVEVDSTYRDSLPPLYVIKQFPAGGDKVKSGRTIQLIVNKAAAPLVEMPALLGVRVSSALQYLQRNNLKLGDTLYKPDFAAGRILQQLVNGVDVKPGTMLKYGTKVTLVIGSGVGDIIYNYPDFYGMTLKQAYAIMDTIGLSRGAISIDPGTKDSLNAFIYKQYPEPIDMFTREPTLIRQGNTVDLFISNIRKPREVDTTQNYINKEQLEEAKANDNAASAEKDKDKKPPRRRAAAAKRPTDANTPPKSTTTNTPPNKGEEY